MTEFTPIHIILENIVMTLNVLIAKITELDIEGEDNAPTQDVTQSIDSHFHALNSFIIDKSNSKRKVG